ncbi:MAG: hypothetical protein JWQ79_1949, partial [Mucilaginibacter sp.]|nr:hypothetical protein [Mucilaginibacter sp.]
QLPVPSLQLLLLLVFLCPLFAAHRQPPNGPLYYMIFYFLKELYDTTVAVDLFIYKTPVGFYVFNVLPRYRSGCKDAINFNTCQVLFSLFLYLFFIRKFQKTTALFD